MKSSNASSLLAFIRSKSRVDGAGDDVEERRGVKEVSCPSPGSDDDADVSCRDDERNRDLCGLSTSSPPPILASLKVASSTLARSSCRDDDRASKDKVSLEDGSGT